MSNLVSTIRTTPTKQEFAAALLAVWPKAEKNSAGILWAHFAGETGDGVHCYCWNLGNVKWTKGCGLDYMMLHGVKEYINGEYVEIPVTSPGSWFRAYPSFEDGMKAFVESKMKGQWRTTWPYVLNGDTVGYATELHNLHYYTEPLANYIKSMNIKFNEWTESDAFENALEEFLESTLDTESQIIDDDDRKEVNE